jgi:hypothetical protein
MAAAAATMLAVVSYATDARRRDADHDQEHPRDQGWPPTAASSFSLGCIVQPQLLQ